MAPLRSQLLSKISGIDHGFLAPGAEPAEGFLRVTQVHGDLVAPSTEPGLRDCKADGIFAANAVTLAIQTADCLPVLFAERSGRAVAAVHAGWRGLNKGILLRAVDRFKGLGVLPGDLVVAIGPAIGRCCFEVSRDVVDEFEKSWSKLWTPATRPWGEGQTPSMNPGRSQAPVSANNLWIDLDRIAFLLLDSAGIPAAQIEQVGHCTYCGPGQLASYRRSTHEGNKASRQWSWISKR